MSFHIEFRSVERNALDQFLTAGTDDQLDFLFRTPQAVLDYWKNLPAPKVDRFTSNEETLRLIDERFAGAPCLPDRIASRLGIIFEKLFSQDDTDNGRTGLLKGGYKLMVADLKVYVYDSDLESNMRSLESLRQNVEVLFSNSSDQMANYEPYLDFISQRSLEELISEVQEFLSRLQALLDYSIERDAVIIELWRY